MKKNILMLTLLIFVFIAGTFSLIGLPNPDQKAAPENPETPGVTVLYDRIDTNCNDPEKPWREKTQCIAGGKQLCSAKYCN